MDNNRQQIVDSIKSKSNILVTVSTDPSVDELSAALGLTILLNNMDKRATAVVSGTVPSAISFLEPDKTFEASADSLRDFIIALDKEKADHLRYKVDGDVVKIFITPYKTTLTQNDLEFSQGDHNVELIIAIGVQDQDHLDKALAAHGRILHDATVVTITASGNPSTLGNIGWHDPAASSLSEMVVSLTDGLKDDKPLLDEQIATAYLTGIVSATERFSNDRTTSRVMTMAAQLMAAGANQQLIAAKLEEGHDIGPNKTSPSARIDRDKPQSEGNQDPGSELTIDRPEKHGKKKRRPEEKTQEKPAEPLVVAPVVPAEPAFAESPTQQIETQVPDVQQLPPQPAADSQPEPVQEAQNQIELEKELAGLGAPVTRTMGDIEKELQEASAALEEPKNEPETASLTAVSDDTMPGFEPAEVPEPIQPPAPTNDLPSGNFEQQAPPAIINDHGTFTSEPPAQAQTLNSIQSEPTEGETTIDPFFAPPAQAEQPELLQPNEPFVPPPLTPLQPSFEAPAPAAIGTPEGAALLATDPAPQPQPQPLVQAEQPAVPAMPALPPLPPLPSDGSLPPLPPPPPLPDFGQATPAPLSGPVPGNVFGDLAAPQLHEEPAPASTPAPSAPEPGQYRIPGQG